MQDNQTQQDPKPAQQDTFALDLSDDTPLPQICDLSGDGTCESCQ